MNCGPATSAGPTLDPVITGIIRKALSDCMDPVKARLGGCERQRVKWGPVPTNHTSVAESQRKPTI